MKKLRYLGTALGVLCTAIAGHAHGQRTLDFTSFDSEIHVLGDGSVTVTERITVHFTGSWNGLLRSIPVEYATGYGANYTLRLELESAEDGVGRALRYEAERSGRNRVFKVWVPGATDATRTVVLRYRVRNGLRFFDEHDELYWNVTGEDTEYPIRAASARVYLPPDASGIRATAFTGAYGSTASDARVTTTSNVVEVEATRPLGFREGLTVVVGWAPGAVGRPTPLDRVSGFLASNFLFAVPLLAFGGMVLLWRRHGRDPRLRPITVQYEPPPGLTPAEVGTLLDTTPDLRDVTATLVDLAVRGYLRVEENRQARMFGLISSQEYSFVALRPRHEWAALKPHEQELLRALFKNDRDTVRSSDLENSFYQDLPRITKHLKQTLVAEGHYLRHPNTVRGAFVALGILAGAIVAVVGAVYLTAVLGQQPLAAIAAGILTAGVVVGFGMVMPARTARGARTLEWLLGFEEFLRRVESDRFERVIRTPELFERFLPYAMALGVERNWARAFDDIYSTPPEWYRGQAADGFRCHVFTGNLGRMASVTGTAMQSAPRSSSSSSGFGGGGGGGFSGGGFGGGSTGGF